jgi:excisionase family DNA binding protein
MESISTLVKFPILARQLQVHLTTLHRWRIAGRLPAVKIGGRWYAKQACVEDWLQAPSHAKRPPPVVSHTPDWAKEILQRAGF